MGSKNSQQDANGGPETKQSVSVRPPPATLRGILRQLGPGLIIAGSIVGSGELIATTKTGAEAGVWLLWLIIIGCVIKVFTQVEFGRYTIVTGRTTLEGLDLVPGPRWRVNWILWYWLIMFLVSMAQLGGIVGGVGQALAIVKPLTAEGAAFNDYQDHLTRLTVAKALVERTRKEDLTSLDRAGLEAFAERLDRLETDVEALEKRRAEVVPAISHDDVLWAVIISLGTSVMLIFGRYRLVQTLSTILVAGFTAVTVGNLIHLQTLPDWRITLPEFLNGLSFRLPPASPESGITPLATALATLGIIGVGATELIQYPYWCREKGYAGWTGPREQSREWLERARGWLRVLKWDAWSSAVVYTFATASFYLVGAAVLGRTGLNPEGTRMVRTLTEMFVPVFGSVAQAIFLFGAVAVLYSTFFVANASHARVCADAMHVFGLSSGSDRARLFWERVFNGLFPLVCLVVYVFARSPVKLVLASGVMQAIMLPMLGGAALYFRYRHSDPRLRPSRWWDLFLWLSFFGLLIAGGWLALTKVFPQMELWV